MFIKTRGDMVTGIDSFLSRLEKVRSRGNNKWQACCPSHNDRNPSLHITLTGSGKILYHCKSGCDQSSVISAMGLTFSQIGDGDYQPKQKEPTVDDYVIEIGRSTARRGDRLNRTDIARYKQAIVAVSRRSR